MFTWLAIVFVEFDARIEDGSAIFSIMTVRWRMVVGAQARHEKFYFDASIDEFFYRNGIPNPMFCNSGCRLDFTVRPPW